MSSIEDLEPMVIEMAVAMHEKLHVNKDRPGWGAESTEYLLTCLDTHIDKLRNNLMREKNPEQLKKDAADCCNFLAMLVDNCDGFYQHFGNLKE